MADPSQAESRPENWVEHTHTDGRVYFYNKITAKSLWEKPEALKSPEERTGASTAWKEYRTADGRPYYYNVFTQKTTWELPDEIAALRYKDEKDGTRTPVYETQEDKKQAFFQMLTDKEVTVKMKWEDVMKLVQDDKRFNIFPSGGEKRQLFGEYLNHKQREEREELRKKRLRAKDDFLALLRSNINDTYDIKENTKFRDVYAELSVHECWEYIDGDKERDELFQDFMDEWEKQDREKKKNDRKQAIEAVKARLEEESLTPTVRWRDICSKLKDDENFLKLKKHDAGEVWDEIPRELAVKVLTAKRKEKYRVERKSRAEFRKVLEEYKKKGKIKLSTEWGDIAESLEDHAALFGIIGNSGSTPRELFLDCKDPLIDAFEDDKNKIRKMMRELNIDLTSRTSFDSFVSEFGGRVEDIPKDHLRMTYEYYIDKATEREKQEREEDDRDKRKKEKERDEEERRERRKREKFQDALEDSDLRASSTYEDADEELGGSSAWKALSDSSRREMIKAYLEVLQEKKRKRATSSDADSAKKDKKDKKEKKNKKEKKKDKDHDDRKRRKHSSSAEPDRKRRHSSSPGVESKKRRQSSSAEADRRRKES